MSQEGFVVNSPWRTWSDEWRVSIEDWDGSICRYEHDHAESDWSDNNDDE